MKQIIKLLLLVFAVLTIAFGAVQGTATAEPTASCSSVCSCALCMTDIQCNCGTQVIYCSEWCCGYPC